MTSWRTVVLCTLTGGCFNPSTQRGEASGTLEPDTGSDASTGGTPDATAADDADSTADAPTGGATVASTGSDDPGTTAAVSTTGEQGCASGGPACPDDQLCIDDTCQDPPAGMVAVPAGTFMMGCNEATDAACAADEFPYHEVDLDAFAIDRTEVTAADFQACVDAGMCASLPDGDAAGNPCVYTPGDVPVSCVSWFQAQDYCAFSGKRLPTEAEWEKAARGADGRLYPWGDDAPTCTLAVFSDCPRTAKQPVGSKPAGASPYGALDMAGNVFEWVADWYAAAYYLESPAANPPGPDAGTRRIIRSAGPNYGAAALRDSFRGVDFEVPTPEATHTNVGFRCALTP